MINFEKIRETYTLLDIAYILGFCDDNDDFLVKKAAMSRICNWSRTGLPTMIIKRHGKVLEKLSS